MFYLFVVIKGSDTTIFSSNVNEVNKNRIKKMDFILKLLIKNLIII